jgi:hypothetical protein
MTRTEVNSTTGDHADLADFFRRLGRELSSPTLSMDDVLEIACRRAYELVPAAEHAAIRQVTDGVPRVVTQIGLKPAGRAAVRSQLPIDVYVEDDTMNVALELASARTDAFDESDRTTATLLATHAALALTAARRLSKIENLERALQTSRRIGTAIGILMANHRVTEKEAFDLLRIASQSSHRKVHDIADDVVHTGELHVPAAPEERHRL